MSDRRGWNASRGAQPSVGGVRSTGPEPPWSFGDRLDQSARDDPAALARVVPARGEELPRVSSSSGEDRRQIHDDHPLALHALGPVLPVSAALACTLAKVPFP